MDFWQIAVERYVSAMGNYTLRVRFNAGRTRRNPGLPVPGWSTTPRPGGMPVEIWVASPEPGVAVFTSAGT